MQSPLNNIHSSAASQHSTLHGAALEVQRNKRPLDLCTQTRQVLDALLETMKHRAALRTGNSRRCLTRHGPCDSMTMPAAATSPLTGISRACEGTTPHELYMCEKREYNSAGAVEGAVAASLSVRLSGATHFALNRCAFSRDAHVAPTSTRAHMALA